MGWREKSRSKIVHGKSGDVTADGGRHFLGCEGTCDVWLERSPHAETHLFLGRQAQRCLLLPAQAYCTHRRLFLAFYAELFRARIYCVVSRRDDSLVAETPGIPGG